MIFGNVLMANFYMRNSDQVLGGGAQNSDGGLGGVLEILMGV